MIDDGKNAVVQLAPNRLNEDGRGWVATVRFQGDVFTGYGKTEAEALKSINDALVREVMDEIDHHREMLEHFQEMGRAVKLILESVEDPDRLRPGASEE